MVPFSGDFPCPVWGEWYAVSNCSSSCSRVRQILPEKKLYIESGLMVENRNCTNERNHFNCKDYANVTTDSDPMKFESIRQNVKCNQNVCSGEFNASSSSK